MIVETPLAIGEFFAWEESNLDSILFDGYTIN